MKKMLGSIFVMLALFLAMSNTVAQENDAVPTLTTPAPMASDSMPSLEGTMWEGTDSRGDFAQYTFLKGGQLRIRSPQLVGTEFDTTETPGDAWTQDGAHVRLEINHYLTLVGTIDGDRIAGNGSNIKGKRWTWEVQRTTVVAKSLPAPLAANGPAETIEIKLNNDGSYAWRGRNWQADELQGEIYQDSRSHRISEVRLLTPHARTPSVANVIEITQIARAVGANPTFQDLTVSVGTPDSAASPHFEFAGQTLVLPIPAGYCAISKDSEVGAELYKLQEQATNGAGKLAASFADCTELAKLQQDPKYKIRSFGNYMIPLLHGKETIFPAGAPPKGFTKAVMEGVEIADVERAAEEKLRAFAANPGPDGRLGSFPLTYDEDSIYLGLVAPFPAVSKTAKVCGVMGVSTVNRVQVFLGLFGECADADSIHALLAQQKINVKAFIGANSK